MQCSLLQQSCNKYRPFSLNGGFSMPTNHAFPFFTVGSKVCIVIPQRFVDSVDLTLWRASLTSFTKAYIRLPHWGHNGRSFILNFITQARDLKEIQLKTQSDNCGLVRIPTPAWANLLRLASE